VRDVFLAIDVGTQSIRAGLLDIDGQLLAAEAEPMELAVPQAGWAEQNPEDWWAAVRRVVRAVVERAGPEAQVQSIGVCGHMHGTTMLAEDGSLLTDAVQLWCDKRAAAIADEVAARQPSSELLALGANVPSPAWSGLKMAWVKRYQPELYARTWRFLTPKDYINYRLTGEAATDRSEASGSLLMDATTLDWSPTLAEALGVDLAKLPPIVPGAQIIGRVGAEAARATGLRTGTPVVAGAGDMLCLLLGMGVTRPGTACDITGSSSIICFYVDEPVRDPRLMNLHGAGPGWIAFGILDSGGLSLKWWKDNFCEPQVAAAQAGDISPYELLIDDAAQVPPGCEGLLFLPYLNGERTLGSADSRGVFFGLHMRHGRAHMTRAVLEGLCFEMRQSLDIVREHGFPVREISTGGGGARSAHWSQIKADVYGLPVTTVASEEAGLTGAMILAAVGVGAYASEAEAAARLVRGHARFTPEPANAARYDALFPLFRSLHDGLQDRFKQAARIGQ
jgi:xylulokinase